MISRTERVCSKEDKDDRDLMGLWDRSLVIFTVCLLVILKDTHMKTDNGLFSTEYKAVFWPFSEQLCNIGL